MTTLKISLRSGERIFINGAVLRTDRKVTLELLNSATFLLEQHVMTPERTTTPLRQLYFMIQTAIMEPTSAERALVMAEGSLRLMRSTYQNPEILGELAAIEERLLRGRAFDCLRGLRKLFAVEDSIMSGAPILHMSGNGEGRSSEKGELKVAI